MSDCRAKQESFMDDVKFLFESIHQSREKFKLNHWILNFHHHKVFHRLMKFSIQLETFTPSFTFSIDWEHLPIRAFHRVSRVIILTDSKQTPFSDLLKCEWVMKPIGDFRVEWGKTEAKIIFNYLWTSHKSSFSIQIFVMDRVKALMTRKNFSAVKFTLHSFPSRLALVFINKVLFMIVGEVRFFIKPQENVKFWGTGKFWSQRKSWENFLGKRSIILNLLSLQFLPPLSSRIPWLSLWYNFQQNSPRN